MASAGHFGPGLFRFLEDLKKHNNRDWFMQNKESYETQVRGPLIRFVSDFAPHLVRISPHYVADPKPVGGSIMRANRDTRFSADKSPYKTMAGAMFRHEKGKVVPSPGFFLHLERGQSFAGIGVHHPDPKTLSLVRQRIASDPKGWKAATSGKEFRKTCVFFGESLQRPPKGFDPAHPCMEDLKRKDFCTQTFFTDRQVCDADFLERFADTCGAATDFMRYLTLALGLKW